MLLLTACGGGAAANGGQTAPTGETPIEPEAATPQMTTGEEVVLFKAESLDEMRAAFSILTMGWSDQLGVNGGFTFRTEGSDEYGEKIILTSPDLTETLTIWMKDGLIVRAEPEYWEMSLLDTDGSMVFAMLFPHMFMFNSFHEQSHVDDPAFIDFENRGSETRDLRHMTVQASHYFVRMKDYSTGEEAWTFEYWLANLGDYSLAVEWMLNMDGNITHYRITELALRE
ncbi:MAG: hypothetical protein KIS85_09525 [Anaerolineales bacterium]|nr:hypothetical protein [Anaerolineales bacterium]